MRVANLVAFSGLDGNKDQPHDRCHREDERIVYPDC
jgi:hypothetical protein